MNNFTIKFESNSQSHAAYPDCRVESVCRELLEQLANNEKYLQITTGQELVLYMFRALLFREYKHLQEQVTFLVDGAEVRYDHNMRNASGIYPPSVYEDCCDILLGCV